MGKRAVDYRKQFRITKDQANGTAVNICTMVFGNMGNDSGTGVGFTRNPGTGENVIYGEYLVNAQGEDVVAGIRTPKAIAEMEQEMPEIYRQLMTLHNRLESHYHEVQDFEFTIEKGILYCLQTRNGKMNARAMVRTSVEMFKEELISKERALLRIEPAILEQLLVPQLAPDFHGKSLAQGLPASPGAASGKIVFDADTAEARGRAGEKIILVREETKPGAYFLDQVVGNLLLEFRQLQSGKELVGPIDGESANVHDGQSRNGDMLWLLGNLFPLTPALSPRERGNRSQVLNIRRRCGLF
jgi:pyruvate,orthophosphate dikinase